MSIVITYPSASRMRIQCAEDVIELPLPLAAPPGPTARKPRTAVPQAQLRRSTRISVPRQISDTPAPVIRSSPKPPPSVAGLVTAGAHKADSLRADLENWNAKIDGNFRVTLKELQRSSPQDLSRQLKTMAKQFKGEVQPSILNVVIEPGKKPIDVSALRDVVKTSAYKLSAIRLLFDPKKV